MLSLSFDLLHTPTIILQRLKLFGILLLTILHISIYHVDRFTVTLRAEQMTHAKYMYYTITNEDDEIEMPIID